MDRKTISSIGDETYFKRVAEASMFHWRAAETRAKLVLAEESSLVDFSSWNRYFTEGVTLESVGGSHTSMLEAPNVEAVASLVVKVHAAGQVLS